MKQLAQVSQLGSGRDVGFTPDHVPGKRVRTEPSQGSPSGAADRHMDYQGHTGLRVLGPGDQIWAQQEESQSTALFCNSFTRKPNPQNQVPSARERVFLQFKKVSQNCMFRRPQGTHAHCFSLKRASTQSREGGSHGLTPNLGLGLSTANHLRGHGKDTSPPAGVLGTSELTHQALDRLHFTEDAEDRGTNSVSP